MQPIKLMCFALVVILCSCNKPPVPDRIGRSASYMFDFPTGVVKVNCAEFIYSGVSHPGTMVISAPEVDVTLSSDCICWIEAGAGRMRVPPGPVFFYNNRTRQLTMLAEKWDTAYLGNRQALKDFVQSLLYSETSQDKKEL